MKNLIEMEKEICQSLEKISTSKVQTGKLFNPFFESIADIAFARIANSEGMALSMKESMEDILDKNILIEKSFFVSKRVLIADMNERSEAGALSGDSDEEKYEDYVWNHLMNPDYLMQLFAKYPVWKESLFQVVEFFVRNIMEMIQHLYSDQKDLNAEFFSTNHFDKIRRIEGCGSDSHGENRIVYRVKLDNDEVLYHKCRVNTGVHFFNDLYEKICGFTGVSSYILPTWTGNGYVWEMEAMHKECENEVQVQNYFVRLGILLSICHLCHSGDMHYQNMLACGEYPLIIDYETLVQMMPNITATRENMADLLIGKSVLSMGILPFYGKPGRAFNADFSGLCGGGKQVMDLKIPTIENSGKSTMRISYKYGETGENRNRLFFKGEAVQPEKYISYLHHGFEAGYVYILEHKTEIKEMMQKMKTSVFRQLFRNTQEYHMILDVSYHPEFMKEPGKRRNFLEEALNTSMFEDKAFILNQEIEDLLIGDIPYFQFDMFTGEIRNSLGKPLKKYFEKTGMDILNEQLEEHSMEDLKLQKQLMDISLKYSRIEGLDRLFDMKEKRSADYSMILNICSKIADLIYENHIQYKGEILWMNTRIMSTGVDQRPTYFVDMSDRYLYVGTMGIAVFMAAFLNVCPEHKIKNIYSKVIRQLMDYTELESKDQHRSTGVFLGEGSMVYGYQLLYQITKEKIFLEYAEKHCIHVEMCLNQDQQYDLIGGNAGAIIAFLNMYDLKQDKQYLEMAVKAGDYLLENAVKTLEGAGWKNPSNDALLGGFAHGCAGITYALARLGFNTHEEKYLEMAYQAFSYEKTMYHPELGGWRDYRAEMPYYISDFKWCHGVAGIILGWHLASVYFDESRKRNICNEIEDILKEFPKMEMKKELCLCHGNIGNRIISELSGVNSWNRFMESDKLKSYFVLQNVLSEEKGNIILHEHYDYSLMTGWSGIGYGLLYDICEDLPGILDVHFK